MPLNVARCIAELAEAEKHREYPDVMSTTALLTERQTTHGDFSDNAKHGQALREYYRTSPNWAGMNPVHREALDQIAGKLSRILSGQATHDDHWKDVAGYATLALQACDKP